MQHLRQLQSEIARHIKGVENVHSAVANPDRLAEFYAALFGSPKHQDGTWSEFEVADLDIAVTAGSSGRSVITFRVEDLPSLHSLLEGGGFPVTGIQRGEYGDYVELSPGEGFVFHFFEPKKKCGTPSGR